jgi:putative cardiolipin synthase
MLRRNTSVLRTLAAGSALILAGCAAFPPGREATPTHAVTQPPNPALVAPFTAAAHAHPDESGFRLFSVGVDGLLLRLELIAAAHSSLDLQYYIFHGDESGRLVTDALSRAAARGVRVRILIDDADSVAGDEQLYGLAAQPNVAIRVFNPWHYRGHNGFLRGTEYLFNHGRLDYRMHNKLFIVDGALALAGGRNIGDQYFQVDPESQFADDDVLVTGPAVPQLAATFEEYWESDAAVAAQSLLSPQRIGEAGQALERRITTPEKAAQAGFDYQGRLAAGEPLAGVLAGQATLAWARAEVACDSPDKAKKVASGTRVGGLLFPPVEAAIRGTQSELTMVMPYLIPTPGELKLLEDERAQQRRVRILTTSLESENDALAQSGYMHYRVPLLGSGVELYEMRARPGNRRGSGESARLTRSGNYSLHAKLMVFDRSAVFIGSMNYDQRSHRLNTENGLIIHSPELATETARRFAAMSEPQNAYAVTLEPTTADDPPHLRWTTVEAGHVITLDSEPARSRWQKLEVHFLALLPLDREL